MPRIPDTEIDRIKQGTDLAALVRSRGIELAKHGNGHLAGPCPFHDDDEPSFIVTPAKGLFHCMGCGVAGNAIQFVEKFDGVSFRHAFELLNDGPAAFTAPPDGHTKQHTVRRLEAPVAPDAADAELFGQVVDYYHERLLSPSGSAALEYLKSRGLFDDDAIKRFRLGFADRTLGLRLPERNRKAGGEIRTRLQKLGLIRDSGHEHFNGCLVVPIFDEQGQLSEMYGRKISKVKNGQYKHLYLPGPHAGIWNAPECFCEAGSVGELILCEAPLDALTFWVNGVRNVTFIFGTEGFADYLFEALLAHRVKTVWLAYDADAAGNRASDRDAARLTAHGIECFRIKFPLGMDANEYAQNSPPFSLARAVNAAEWLGGAADGTCMLAPALIDIKLAANKLAANEEPPSATPEGETDIPVCAAQGDADIPACDPVDPVNPAQGNPAPVSDPSANFAPPREISSLERVGDYHTLTLGKREYRVGGLEKNNSLDVLKVSVRLRYGDDFHLDSFDMTRDGERRRFIERAAEETGLEKDLLKRDIGRLLLALEDTQQQRLSAATESTGERKHELTDEEHAEALAFLKSPNLVERIAETFEACGLVGEETNRLAAYLACTSRKLDRPLAVIIQSTSAAGKSTLMEAVLAMFPEEDRVQYSAMTGQSLYYLGETNLKHKILAIVEEEGAEKASYALKLLQSEGELTIASTGKDQHTGRMETQEYHVEGPVMIFLTTTAIDIDEELQNRCLTLTVDESRAQTERIHTMQRQARTLEGLRLKKHRQNMLTLLRNVQRLLEPLDVVNPYADRLTFTAERTRTRRDHEKYLTLIDTITLLHQHQRGRSQMTDDGGRKSEDAGDPTSDLRPPTSDPGSYITVTLDDIELANRIAPELLGHSLDELPPQTRLLLDHIKALVRDIGSRDDVEQQLALFSRRHLCAATGWTYSQVKRHLIRLQELELIVPRYGGMGTTMRYELLVDSSESDDTTPKIGLLDVESLRESTGTPPTRTPGKATLTPPCQNRMTRLSPLKPASNANLATFPERTSGTAAFAAVP
jgi:DNA primase